MRGVLKEMRLDVYRTGSGTFPGCRSTNLRVSYINKRQGIMVLHTGENAMFTKWEYILALAFAIPWAILTLADRYFQKRMNKNLLRRQANVNDNTKRRN